QRECCGSPLQQVNVMRIHDVMFLPMGREPLPWSVQLAVQPTERIGRRGRGQLCTAARVCGGRGTKRRQALRCVAGLGGSIESSVKQATTLRADSSQVKRAERAIAARAKVSRCEGDARIVRIAAAIESISVASKYKPASPITSGREPARLETTGVPQA